MKFQGFEEAKLIKSLRPKKGTFRFFYDLNKKAMFTQLHYNPFYMSFHAPGMNGKSLCTGSECPICQIVNKKHALVTRIRIFILDIYEAFFKLISKKNYTIKRGGVG